jgi:hypothetical protein
MTRPNFNGIGFAGVAALLMLATAEVQAAATITIVESGGNTSATVSGSIDTTGLSCGVFSFIGNAIEMNPPSTESVRVNIEGGAGEATRCDIDPITTTYGTGTQDLAGNRLPDSVTGTPGAGVGVFNSGFAGVDRLLLPNGYVSGSPLSGSATWNGLTLVNLGLGEGVFVITTGVDTLTLDISRQGAPPAFNVTASVVGGNGSVSCTPTSVASGGSSTCTAVPDTGFEVSAWTGDCAASGTSTTCALSNIDANRSSTVAFAATGGGGPPTAPTPAPTPVPAMPLWALLLVSACLGALGIRKSKSK